MLTNLYLKNKNFLSFGDLLSKRKSSRNFTEKNIGKEDIEHIIFAGMQAPSGKNGQPWKFIVIQEDKSLLEKISALTIYDGFVRTADCLIAVFLDKTQSYNYIKDCQAIGACIQNMLLQATELGIDSCWIGEIVNRDTFVKQLLGVGNSLDLMAVIALGYSEDKTKQPPKKPIEQCLIKRI